MTDCIHLEHAFAVDDVEARAAGDGIGDQNLINKKFAFQRQHQRPDMFRPQAGDKIGILGRAHHPIECACNRSADEIRDAQFLEDRGHFQRDGDGGSEHDDYPYTLRASSSPSSRSARARRNSASLERG